MLFTGKDLKSNIKNNPDKIQIPILPYFPQIAPHVY